MAQVVRSALRVVRYDDGTDRWEFVYGRPHPQLRLYVLRYCGYDEHTSSFTRRLEAAGVELPLIINLGPPLGVRLSSESSFTDYADGFLGGMHDGFAVVDSHGSQRGLEIGLTPVGAQRLLGLSMREVASRVVPIDLVFGAVATHLRAQLLEAADWPECFAIAERFLIDRLAASPAPPAALEWALSRMHATAGNLDIGSLTDELGCSRRYLIGAFNEYVGIPPKLFARILRFQRACALADMHKLRWSEIAQRCGYYDHAHLIRDFQQFAGRTPVSFSDGSLAGAGVRA
ncbi:MAG: helix-turn-helix transcriptional regulator [Actinomycetota bacterium]|nr:helix-turn-helix transcriptional regulator [Actinomycetota bacterium]